jgi:predicted nucleotidyltransferase
MVKKIIPIKLKKQIKSYVDILRKDELPISKVILYGSYATGTSHQWSDIDLCIISPRFKDAFDATQYLWSKRVIKDIKYAIEPVGFSVKDFKQGSILINEIKRTGVEMVV